MSTAYNAYDTTQQSFLSALALGETGNASNAYSVGFGGSDLTGSPVDQYGFPQWNGADGSHAAGAFQFQPGTWDEIASQYNLNFSNPQDQNAGAWYEAQQAYSQKTGGDLETDLNAGLFTKVQSALGSIWPSVSGNAAAPQGLAATLASGGGATIAGGSTAAPVSSDQSQPSGILPTIENWFLRGGLLVVGTLVILVSLWMLMANHGIVPGPKKLAKAII